MLSDTVLLRSSHWIHLLTVNIDNKLAQNWFYYWTGFLKFLINNLFSWYLIGHFNFTNVNNRCCGIVISKSSESKGSKNLNKVGSVFHFTISRWWKLITITILSENKIFVLISNWAGNIVSSFKWWDNTFTSPVTSDWVCSSASPAAHHAEQTSLSCEQ